jgi:hypothetical protein
MNNNQIILSVVLVILYLISTMKMSQVEGFDAEIVSTAQSLVQISAPKFNLIAGLTNNYNVTNVATLASNNLIDATTNYTLANGSLLKLWNDITIDCKSLNDNGLSLATLLYNDSKCDVNVIFKVPTFTATDSNPIISSGYKPQNDVLTLKAGKLHFVYYLPIVGMNQVPAINQGDYNDFNGKIINSNVSFTYHIPNITKSFNVIIYYSSLYNGQMNASNGVSYPLSANSFYLIYNSPVNSTLDNRMVPIRLNQYNVVELN